MLAATALSLSLRSTLQMRSSSRELSRDFPPDRQWGWP